MKAIRTIQAAAVMMLVPMAAHAQASCESYARQAAELAPDYKKALQLMQARDIPGLRALLPALQAHLARIAPSPLLPQQCGAQVRVYDPHAFGRIAALRKAGKPVMGFGADADFVSADLNFGNLAYVVGWIEFELGDFEAARIAYAKGLAITPDEHNLSKEYVAVLLNQGKFADLIAFVDRFLASDDDLEPKERANLIAAKGMGEAALGDLTAAKKSADRANAIDPGNEYAGMIATIVAQKRKKP